MTVKIEVNISNKWLYFIVVVGALLVLGGGVWAYNSDMKKGDPPVFGHSAGEINVDTDGDGKADKNLQEALNSIINEGSEFKYNTSGSMILGLIPGKKYLVNVYGVTRNAGQGSEKLWAIGVSNCKKSPGVLIETRSSIGINWPDGQAPQSASFVVKAPADGCIRGYCDGRLGKVLYISALSI